MKNSFKNHFIEAAIAVSLITGAASAINNNNAIKKMNPVEKVANGICAVFLITATRCINHKIEKAIKNKLMK